MDLSSKQRAFLRGLGSDLEPVVHIGKNGVSPEAVESIGECFNTRELLKGNPAPTRSRMPPGWRRSAAAPHWCAWWADASCCISRIPRSPR